jgi:hypothetical protein
LRAAGRVCNAEAVKLLEAEHQAAPPAEPEAPAPEAPEAQPLPEGATACRACGAPMEPGQDWCLSCGTAADGTLGQRPGWRAVRTVLALTALLVLGAAAASYAALTDEGAKPPTAPVAQAPVPAATPPAATTPPAAPTPAKTPKAGKLPKVKAPKATSTPTPAATPVTPVTPAAQPSSSAPASTSSSGAATGSSSSSTDSGSGGSSSTTPAGPSPVVLASGAASLYDPYSRVASSGVPARAIDADPSTSWFVEPTPKPGTGPDSGLLIDLGAKRDLRGVVLQTTTPGFNVEIWATSDASAPPNILDSRWSHIVNRKSVGTNERIAIGNDTSKYRNLLLWFRSSPKTGTKIRVTNVEVLS